MNIKKIYNSDQADRKKLIPKGEFDLLNKNDKKRRGLIYNLIKSSTKFSAEEMYHIAFILHHSPFIKDSNLAIKYAKKSFDLGFKKAGWLYAATIDRLCMKRKLPQKYGTQYFKKDANSKFELYKTDESITDKERIELGVPTLKEAQENVKNFN